MGIEKFYLAGLFIAVFFAFKSGMHKDKITWKHILALFAMTAIVGMGLIKLEYIFSEFASFLK